MKLANKKIVLGAAATILVGFVGASLFWFGSGNEQQAVQLSRPRNVDMTIGGEGQTSNPQFRESQIALDNLRADRAVATGTTALAVPNPVPIARVETPAAPAAPAAPEPAKPVVFDPYAGLPAAPQAQIQTVSNADLKNQMRAFLQTEMSTRQTIAAPTMRNYASSERDPAAGAQAAAVAAASPAPEQCLLQSAGRIDYARMINAVKSTQPGPVLVEVLAGPFRGSRLLGAFERQDEAMFLRFTQLATETSSISVDAIAVSPTTSETAVASYVDRHYFSRFVLPIAAQFISGFGQAIARAGTATTTSAGPLGSSTTTSPLRNLNTTEQLLSAAGTAGQTASQLFAENAPKGPTVGILPNEPLGIMWIRPVSGPC